MTRLRNIPLSLLLLGAFFLCCALPARAQDDSEPVPVAKSLRDEVVDSVVSGYSDWGRVSISGKFSSPMLPVSASVKIYMEKDKLTLISVTAPLVGEAARIEMDEENLLIVNKLNRTYTLIDIEDIEKLYPGGLKDIQSLLLGRVTLMGKGTIRKLNAGNVEIYDAPQDRWLIYPDVQPEGVTYLFMVGKEGFRTTDFMLFADDDASQAQCRYSWRADGGCNVDFEATDSRMKFSGTLSLNAPLWGANAFDRFEITPRYNRVTAKELMKMF